MNTHLYLRYFWHALQSFLILTAKLCLYFSFVGFLSDTRVLLATETASISYLTCTLNFIWYTFSGASWVASLCTEIYRAKHVLTMTTFLVCCIRVWRHTTCIHARPAQLTSNDSVEYRSIIISLHAKLYEISASQGSLFRPELDVDIAQRRMQQHLQKEKEKKQRGRRILIRAHQIVGTF